MTLLSSGRYGAGHKADAAPEPRPRSSNLHGSLQSHKPRAGMSCPRPKAKFIFLCLDFSEVPSHLTFLICTAKQRIDISKAFPMVVFSSDTGTLFLHMGGDDDCKLPVISLTVNQRF